MCDVDQASTPDRSLETDRLVAGARPDPVMEGPARLLGAGQGPPPGDLAGERATVAGLLTRPAACCLDRAAEEK